MTPPSPPPVPVDDDELAVVLGGHLPERQPSVRSAVQPVKVPRSVAVIAAARSVGRKRVRTPAS
jgi:hypothetical protein